jgi:hypothetical protein
MVDEKNNYGNYVSNADANFGAISPNNMGK